MSTLINCKKYAKQISIKTDMINVVTKNAALLTFEC